MVANKSQTFIFLSEAAKWYKLVVARIIPLRTVRNQFCFVKESLFFCQSNHLHQYHHSASKIKLFLVFSNLWCSSWEVSKMKMRKLRRRLDVVWVMHTAQKWYCPETYNDNAFSNELPPPRKFSESIFESATSLKSELADPVWAHELRPAIVIWSSFNDSDFMLFRDIIYRDILHDVSCVYITLVHFEHGFYKLLQESSTTDESTRTMSLRTPEVRRWTRWYLINYTARKNEE